ncbi:MAG: hypothetical protein AB1861_06955 [Cyanobacteriota bacterium]
MADIQFEVQGQDAVTATEELLSISGVSGSYETEGEAEREGTLATIGVIVGIVGGAIAIAEQIRKWYQQYKQGKSGKKIDKVLLVSRSGKRLLLENATIEQIKEILDE